MPAENKPSRNEEEYFTKLEAERIERKKLELARLSQDAERKSHHMRCPKCGGHLVTKDFNKLQIDQCPDCQGVWLDAGEMEAVMALEERGFMSKALGDFFGTLRGKKK